VREKKNAAGEVQRDKKTKEPIMEEYTVMTIETEKGKRFTGETEAFREKLVDADQTLLDNIVTKPQNVIVDGSQIANDKARQDWERQVYMDLATLAGTTAGGDLMKEIQEAGEPQQTRVVRKDANGQPLRDEKNKVIVDTIEEQSKATVPITIVPRSGGDNKTSIDQGRRGPASVTIHYDPNDRIGDIVKGNGSRDRPPYIGLGKEMSTAKRAILNEIGDLGNTRTKLKEERESRSFENQLRREHDPNMPQARDVPLP
jgi:hypothetical protein